MVQGLGVRVRVFYEPDKVRKANPDLQSHLERFCDSGLRCEPLSSRVVGPCLGHSYIRVPRSCCYSITRYHGRLHSAERLEYLNVPEVEYSRATDRSAMVQSIILTDLLRYSRSFHVQPLRD